MPISVPEVWVKEQVAEVGEARMQPYSCVLCFVSHYPTISISQLILSGP